MITDEKVMAFGKQNISVPIIVCFQMEAAGGGGEGGRWRGY